MSVKADPTANLDEDFVIVLPKPIEWPAGAVTQIVIREPTAGEMEQWDKLTGAEADIKAITICAGVPEPVVRALKAREFLLASRRIGAFLA